MELKKSNEKWSGRLGRARAKDFTMKQGQVEVCMFTLNIGLVVAYMFKITFHPGHWVWVIIAEKK